MDGWIERYDTIIEKILLLTIPAHDRDYSRRRQNNIIKDAQVKVGTDGDNAYHHPPYLQDIMDGIYDRGRHRRIQELEKRGHNISGIEPFNPHGPIYIWDWFSPDYNCPTMERVGRVGDGGKWICDVDILTDRKCVVYSYGVNDDLSFELELIERTGCEVHAFDPTVGGLPRDCQDNPRITFHKQALGPHTGPSDTFMLVENLLDTMKAEGHTFIDVLKVGSEEEGGKDPINVHVLHSNQFPKIVPNRWILKAQNGRPSRPCSLRRLCHSVNCSSSSISKIPMKYLISLAIWSPMGSASSLVRPIIIHVLLVSCQSLWSSHLSIPDTIWRGKLALRQLWLFRHGPHLLSTKGWFTH